MRPLSVVDLFDEPWQPGLHTVEGFVAVKVDFFDLERFHETLGLRIVVQVACRVHRSSKAERL
jgi:hypothetical protein